MNDSGPDPDMDPTRVDIQNPRPDLIPDFYAQSLILTPRQEPDFRTLIWSQHQHLNQDPTPKLDTWTETQHHNRDSTFISRSNPDLRPDF